MAIDSVRRTDAPDWAGSAFRLPELSEASQRPAPPAGTPRWERRYARALMAMDLGVASVAAVLGLVLRFGQDFTPVYAALTALLPPLWVGVLAAGRAYEGRYLATGSEEYRRVFESGVRLLALTAVLALAVRYELARGYVLLVLPLTLLGSLAGRRVARSMVAARRRRGRMQHRVIATGTERAVAELVREIRREPGSGYTVVGVCVDRAGSRSVEGLPVLGGSRDVVDVLRRERADTVAVGAWSSYSQVDLRRLGWQLEGTGADLLVAPSLTDVAGPRISFRPVSGLSLIHVEQPQFRGVRRVMKGLFDRSVALGLLVVAAVPMLAIAAIVRATSTGLALFRQTRVGLDGRHFTMLKFRSMRVTAEDELRALLARNEGDGVLFKMRDDPRVTPIGRWLRRFSLDELPQLINVLRGDMSLVGPRPPLPREVEQYGDDVRRRLLVKPGITGLWQVKGRSDLSWEESVRLDLYYVENWSPALDAQILWRTASAVLASRGAY
ncbi:MAG: sugar transferase [Actinomycetota bacterium]|nr:sugar transferase [Actinomycetota bacterium]